jgi:hypothetical protein
MILVTVEHALSLIDLKLLAGQWRPGRQTVQGGCHREQLQCKGNLTLLRVVSRLFTGVWLATFLVTVEHCSVFDRTEIACRTMAGGKLAKGAPPMHG